MTAYKYEKRKGMIHVLGCARLFPNKLAAGMYRTANRSHHSLSNDARKLSIYGTTDKLKGLLRCHVNIIQPPPVFMLSANGRTYLGELRTSRKQENAK